MHLSFVQPENIFIKNNKYKLGDFGLVSKIENHDDVEEGDSRYMSMELLSGDLDDLTKVRCVVVTPMLCFYTVPVSQILLHLENLERHILSRGNHV